MRSDSGTIYICGRQAAYSALTCAGISRAARGTYSYLAGVFPTNLWTRQGRGRDEPPMWLSESGECDIRADASRWTDGRQMDGTVPCICQHFLDAI